MSLTSLIPVILPGTVRIDLLSIGLLGLPVAERPLPISLLLLVSSHAAVATTRPGTAGEGETL